MSVPLEQTRSLPGAIVTGADYRGLGVVRSLGRRGIPVWTLRHGDHRVASFSKYATRVFDWQGDDPKARINYLLDLADKHNLEGWVLFPTDDYAVSVISQHHECLAKRFRMTIPPWAELRCLVDKWQIHNLADKLGIPKPWTFLPSHRQEVAAFDGTFPVILKPRSRETSNPFSDAKAWRANSLDELLLLYDKACELISPDLVMVQECIPGSGESQVSFAVLCEQGNPLAYLTAKRARQFPMDFGRASTFVEAVEIPEIVEPSVRLLAATRFTGMVEIEYKRDQRDSQYKLLEANPRVWGWQTLCARAGIDFPYFLWLSVQGLPVPPVHRNLNVRWVRMTTDLLVVLGEMTRGRMSLRSYLKSLRGPMEWAIYAPDDPLPFFVEIPLLIYQAARRILGGRT
jgi:predicted ATP-grasp superfamily ATP-dependent carboligase